MDVELLSKMISELIVDHDRVGLPGVGTFYTEVVPSTFSDRGYTINPPYRRLSFLPNAVENDLLVDFYSEVNGTPADMAREYIVQFLRELAEVLKERKTIILPGLGRLRATKENNFFFVADETLDIYPEAFGLAPVSLKNIPGMDDDKVDIRFEFKPPVQKPSEPAPEAVEPVGTVPAERLSEPAGVPEAVEPSEPASAPEPSGAESGSASGIESPAVEDAREAQERDPEAAPIALESAVTAAAAEPFGPDGAEASGPDVNAEIPEAAETEEETSEPAGPDVQAEGGSDSGCGAGESVLPVKKFRWWIPLLVLFASAAIFLAVFLILAHVAPDFIDSILYTPEELRIINY